MKKHTNGQWICCNPGDYSDFDGDSIVILAYDDDVPFRLAVVQGSNDNSKKAACLIVSAPDMLEALMKISDATREEYINRFAIRDIARAAIAKAEGKI